MGVYNKGIHQIGNGVWAYLLPDGDWGYSNSGLIESDGQFVLIDTLFDKKLTLEMFELYKNLDFDMNSYLDYLNSSFSNIS